MTYFTFDIFKISFNLPSSEYFELMYSFKGIVSLIAASILFSIFFKFYQVISGRIRFKDYLNQLIGVDLYDNIFNKILISSILLWIMLYPIAIIPVSPVNKAPTEQKKLVGWVINDANLKQLNQIETTDTSFSNDFEVSINTYLPAIIALPMQIIETLALGIPQDPQKYSITISKSENDFFYNSQKPKLLLSFSEESKTSSKILYEFHTFDSSGFSETEAYKDINEEQGNYYAKINFSLLDIFGELILSEVTFDSLSPIKSSIDFLKNVHLFAGIQENLSGAFDSELFKTNMEKGLIVISNSKQSLKTASLEDFNLINKSSKNLVSNEYKAYGTSTDSFADLMKVEGLDDSHSVYSKILHDKVNLYIKDSIKNNFKSIEEIYKQYTFITTKLENVNISYGVNSIIYDSLLQNKEKGITSSQNIYLSESFDSTDTTLSFTEQLTALKAIDIANIADTEGKHYIFTEDSSSSVTATTPHLRVIDSPLSDANLATNFPKLLFDTSSFNTSEITGFDDIDFINISTSNDGFVTYSIHSDFSTALEAANLNKDNLNLKSTAKLNFLNNLSNNIIYYNNSTDLKTIYLNSTIIKTGTTHLYDSLGDLTSTGSPKNYFTVNKENSLELTTSAINKIKAIEETSYFLFLADYYEKYFLNLKSNIEIDLINPLNNLNETPVSTWVDDNYLTNNSNKILGYSFYRYTDSTTSKSYVFLIKEEDNSKGEDTSNFPYILKKMNYSPESLNLSSANDFSDFYNLNTKDLSNDKALYKSILHAQSKFIATNKKTIKTIENNSNTLLPSACNKILQLTTTTLKTNEAICLVYQSNTALNASIVADSSLASSLASTTNTSSNSDSSLIMSGINLTYSNKLYSLLAEDSEYASSIIKKLKKYYVEDNFNIALNQTKKKYKIKKNIIKSFMGKGNSILNFMEKNGEFLALKQELIDKVRDEVLGEDVDCSAYVASSSSQITSEANICNILNSITGLSSATGPLTWVNQFELLLFAIHSSKQIDGFAALFNLINEKAMEVVTMIGFNAHSMISSAFTNPNFYRTMMEEDYFSQISTQNYSGGITANNFFSKKNYLVGNKDFKINKLKDSNNLFDSSIKNILSEIQQKPLLIYSPTKIKKAEIINFDNFNISNQTQKNMSITGLLMGLLAFIPILGPFLIGLTGTMMLPILISTLVGSILFLFFLAKNLILRFLVLNIMILFLFAVFFLLSNLKFAIVCILFLISSISFFSFVSLEKGEFLQNVKHFNIPFAASFFLLSLNLAFILFAFTFYLFNTVLFMPIVDAIWFKILFMSLSNEWLLLFISSGLLTLFIFVLNIELIIKFMHLSYEKLSEFLLLILNNLFKGSLKEKERIKESFSNIKDSKGGGNE